MQLMKPHFTTTKTGRSTKPSAKQIQAKSEHEAWLRKNGVHPDQLTKAKLHKIAVPSYKTEGVQLSNTIVDGGRAKGIMANLHKESAATRAAILEKASRVAPLYNKGGLQLLGKNEDLTKIGSLSRRG
jgi:hypothetical protein